MKITDIERIALNEDRIRQSESVTFIRNLPGFPYSSLEQVRSAKEAGDITLAAEFSPDLIRAIGTKTEILVQYFWVTVPLLCGIAYVIAAIVTGRLALLFGLITTTVGFFLSTPYVGRVANPLVGFAWIPCAYFAFTAPIWAWVIGGFYGGYICATIVRLQFRMVIEERALSSEVFFCYLFLNRILLVRDNITNTIL